MRGFKAGARGEFMDIVRAAVFGSIMVGVGACSREEPATTIGEGEIEAFLTKDVELFCAQYFDCGCAATQEDDGSSLVSYTSREDCLEEGKIEYQEVRKAGQDAGLTFDIECLKALQARFVRLGCAPDWKDTGPYIRCKTHYGDRGLGEPCTFVWPASGDDCLPDLLCESDRCVELRPQQEAGDRCAFQWPYCVDDAYCRDPDGDGVLVCVANPAEGEPCPEDGSCDDLACDPQTNTCVQRRGLGELCGPGQPSCGAGLICPLDVGATEGVCVVQPVAAEGESCDLKPCGEGLSCDNAAGVCVVPGPFVCWGGDLEMLPPYNYHPERE